MHSKKILLSIIILIVSLWSCNKKKLNQPPFGLLNESDVTNKSGVEKLLIGAYSLLDGAAEDDQGSVGAYGTSSSNWIYGSICGSEAYRGSYDYDPTTEITNIENFSAGPTNYYFDAKWSAIYAGVARANTVLRVMRQAKDMTTADTTEVRAEALFLRAFYHFEAIKLWNKVPFVDENVTYNAGNYYLDNDTLIWPAIENDLKYAMNNLPPVQGTAVGRVNSYAAKAFLAKAYMFEHRYSDAKPILEDLIANGVTAGGIKYSLGNYADNFNIQFKNQSESVFAIQASVNDNSGGGNGNQADILNFPLSTINASVPGGCCGFFQPSQYLINHFKTDAVTGLPDPDSFNSIDSIDVKNDEGVASEDPFTPYSGTLDPRLDWTVGRRGVPYLDWGPNPGNGWIRQQSWGGPYLPKKNIYYRQQQAQFTDASFWSTGATANNVDLIRFADIILWAAEAEVRIGDLNKARDYVNIIRARAADSSGWVKNDDNIPYAKKVTNSQAEFDAINDATFVMQQYDWVVRKDLNQTWVLININADGTKVWNPYSIPNYKIGLYTTSWADRVSALKAVQYERVLELAMEGHRFFDLVRWEIADTEINAYLLNEQKLRSYLDGAVFIKGKNEYFPIPQHEIDLSVDAKGVQHLHQNPGY
ncbi:MAG: RagB/SusD family nutrient uptake outer membrane protein [Chitinophagales bacterium]